MNIFKLCIFTLIIIIQININLAYAVSNKEKQYKGWWVIKNGTSCWPAVKFLSLENMLKNYPGCKRNKEFQKGVFILDCQKTVLNTSFFYARSKSICQEMIKNFKSQGLQLCSTAPITQVILGSGVSFLYHSNEKPKQCLTVINIYSHSF